MATGFQQQVFRNDSRYQTNMQAAIVAVVAERYRLKHGRWPRALTDLVPEFLQKVPGELASLPSPTLIQDDGNFKIGVMLLHDPKQRRQPPLPWVFTSKPTPSAGGVNAAEKK
jgi:hypothetical protein